MVRLVPLCVAGPLALWACASPSDEAAEVDAGEEAPEPRHVYAAIPLEIGDEVVDIYLRLERSEPGDGRWFTGSVGLVTGAGQGAHEVLAIAERARDYEPSSAIVSSAEEDDFDRGWVFELAPDSGFGVGEWGSLRSFRLALVATPQDEPHHYGRDIEAGLYEGRIAFARGEAWIRQYRAAARAKDVEIASPPPPDEVPFSDRFVTADPEDVITRGRARLEAPFAEPLAPTDPVFVRYSMPVTMPGLLDHLQILADGDELDGRIDADGFGDAAGAGGSAVLATRFTPPVLPPSVDIELSAGGLESTLFTPVEPAGPTLHTIDAGDVDDNLAFEDELAGWGTHGEVATASEIEGIEPLEGERQLHIENHGYAAGYVDIPDDAEALSLGLGALGGFASVRLAAESGERRGLDPEDLTEAPPCLDGEEVGHICPVLAVSDLGGERAALTISLNVERSPYPSPWGTDLLVDDIRFE